MKAPKLKTLVPAVLAFSALSVGAAENDPKWIIHARSVAVAPVTHSVLALNATTTFAPELDFTRMLDSNFGIELILATTKHDVKLSGADFGKVSVLPPTLTLTYRLDSMAGFRPYFGFGVNYTLFYNVELPGAYNLERRSLGMVAQVGCDYAVGDRWVLNFDLKKIDLQADVKSGGTTADVLQLNPLVWGLGVGYRI